MVIGLILPPPESRVEANMKSDHAQRKANSEVVTMVLRESGITILVKTPHCDAPSICAASTSERGIPDINPVIRITANGTDKVESATISPGILSRRPMSS